MSTKQSNDCNGSNVKRSNGKKRSRGRSRVNEDKRGKLEMEDKRLSDQGRDNDPNWYFTSSELATQAGELSIQEVLGNGPVIEEAVIPTCAVVYLNPCPGVSYAMSGNEDKMDGWRTTNSPMSAEILPTNAVINDGANLMAFKMYTLMSSFTGRTQSYAPQDLLIMILAISQVAAISEHIRRAFGMALTVNARNRALPKGMMEAMGIRPDDFIAHLADYRMQFNIQMTRINQVPLLDNIGFIRKCRDIYQKVYVDTDSPMGQNWIFAPWSTWQLDESSSDKGGFLKTVDLPHSNAPENMSSWLGILTGMIDAILSSSTMQIVYSDLINLANKVNVPTWQFDYLAENYVVLPEYNRNAQLQFHNLDIVGQPINSELWVPNSASSMVAPVTPKNDVVQDPDNNCILFNPMFMITRSAYAQAAANGALVVLPHSTIVDFDVPNPTLEDRIEALRFSNCLSNYKFKATNAAQAESMMVTYGGTLSDHYVVRVDVLTYPDFATYIDQSDQRDDGNSLLKDINYLGKFRDAPLLYILGESGTGLSNRRCVRSIAGDVNYFTKVPFEYLQRTNRLMYTGLFDFRV